MADSVTRKLIVVEARRRNWQVSTIGHNDYFCKITTPDNQVEIFRGSRPLKNSANGLVICKYKDLTMEYVEAFGYKLPSYIALEVIDLLAARHFLGRHRQVVVKPVDGQQSLGITTAIKTPNDLEKAMNLAFAKSRSGKIIIQQQLTGKLYRLLVVNGSLVAAAYRKAPEVIGDGRQTIRQLIQELNKDIRRGTANDTPKLCLITCTHIYILALFSLDR